MHSGPLRSLPLFFPPPRVAIVDWIGTCVDMRTSMTLELECFGNATGLTVDWSLLLDAWLAADCVLGHKIVRGILPWQPLEQRIKDCLWDVFRQFGLDERRILPEAVEALGRGLVRMRPWADSVTGVAAMRKLLPVALYSINSEENMREAALRTGMEFDHTISADRFRSYPPAVEGYLGAVELLGVRPNQVVFFSVYALVVAAVADAGMQVVQVMRPTEQPWMPVFDAQGDQRPVARVQDLRAAARYLRTLVATGR